MQYEQNDARRTAQCAHASHLPLAGSLRAIRYRAFSRIWAFHPKLLEAKKLIGHGNWLPWLRDHCQLTERTAQRYMRLANSGMKSDTVSDLGIRGSLDAIAARQDPRTDALSALMAESGCRGTYAVDGITFPDDLSYQEWVAVGEVLRKCPGLTEAVFREWLDEGMRRAKAAPFDPCHVRSKLEFAENTIVDAAWIEGHGRLPLHPEGMDQSRRSVRDFPPKPYADIDASWWAAAA